MKKCSKCGNIKDESCFPFQNKAQNKLMSACKTCTNTATREYRKSKPDEVREWDRKKYLKSRERCLEYAREYRKKYPDRTMATNLKVKYGITRAEYDNKLSEQNNACAICNKPREKHSRNFAVDHNHATGNIRGLLCDGCNYGVGFLEKYRDKYEEYLSRYGE